MIIYLRSYDAVYYLGTPFFQAGHKQNYHRSAQNVPNEWLGSSLMSLQRQQPGRNKVNQNNGDHDYLL